MKQNECLSRFDLRLLPAGHKEMKRKWKNAEWGWNFIMCTNSIETFSKVEWSQRYMKLIWRKIVKSTPLRVLHKIMFIFRENSLQPSLSSPCNSQCFLRCIAYILSFSFSHSWVRYHTCYCCWHCHTSLPVWQTNIWSLPQLVSRWMDVVMQDQNFWMPYHIGFGSPCESKIVSDFHVNKILVSVMAENTFCSQIIISNNKNTTPLIFYVKGQMFFFLHFLRLY